MLVRRLFAILGSPWSILVVLLGFGFGLAACCDWSPQDAQQKFAAPPHDKPSARVGEIYRRVVSVPHAGRPALIESILADPSLPPADAAWINASRHWLYRVTPGIDIPPID